MNNQFPGGYGQAPPVPGYGSPPGGGLVRAPEQPPPGPTAPGNRPMYNGTSSAQQDSAMYGGMPTTKQNVGPPMNYGGPPMQNGPPVGVQGGPQGDMHSSGPRGPPGMNQDPPNQFLPSSSIPGAGQQFRGPVPPMGQPRPTQGMAMPPLSVNQMTGQMGVMSMSHGAPAQMTGNIGSPAGPSVNQPPSSMAPPLHRYGTPIGAPLPPLGTPQMNTSNQQSYMSPSPQPPPTSSSNQQSYMSMSASPRPPPTNSSNQQGSMSTQGLSGPPQTNFPVSQTGPPQGPGHFSTQGAGQFPPSSVPGQIPPPGIQFGQSSTSSEPSGFPQMNAPPHMGSPNQMPPDGQFSQQQPGGQFVGSVGPPTSAYQQQGYQGFGGSPAQQRMPAPMQPPAQKKLDPDQMPSPIQVIEDDKRNRGGIFTTAAKGTVPPLVTTKFVTQDQGNCNPSFVRATMYNIPCTGDMLKNSNIPMALTISPFAKLQQQENEPPIVELGEIGPVRCVRCKAYMNPFMVFIDGGRRFQCVFCGAASDVPAEYFVHLDHTGRRIDWYQRPELSLGSYEFVATKDYCKNGVLPNAPAFIFMIDVSYTNVKSGLVHLICDRLRSEVLANLPKETGADESEIRVGFVTYAKEIHFYNVKGSLALPQMLVVSDLEDVFVPLLDGFLVKLSESDTVIESLLAQIPQMFADSRETETVLGPVIQAGLDALKSADRSGKLFIFHATLPIAEAPGKLKNRDDRKLLGTEKEKTVLTPQTNFYTKLGQECVTAGCSVDLFLFPNAYVDIATIGEVCRLTGGSMYKYSYFQADLDGNRFMDDLKRNVANQRSFDAILRVRTSTGIRPVDFLGNFYMSNTTDVEMAAINSDQAISVEMKHDDKLSEGDGAFIQIAVLYTSVGGQRRLRVHNMSLNCCTQFADLFRACELDTIINFLTKVAIRNILNTNPKQVREVIMNQVANVLACYRKNCASPSSAGQLILPDGMKLLPLYGNCVIKSDGIQGGSEISTDDRSYLMHLMNSMDVKSCHVFLYPRLIPLHDLDLDSHELSTPIRCSADRLQENGVYLLENGVSMFIWIGHNVDPDWVQKVFGVQSAAQIDIDKCQLLELDTPLSQRVREVIKQVRSERSHHMKLTIVRQRDKLEPWFSHFLVEDKGLNGTASYVDFLCHIHKEIRNLLS